MSIPSEETEVPVVFERKTKNASSRKAQWRLYFFHPLFMAEEKHRDYLTLDALKDDAEFHGMPRGYIHQLVYGSKRNIVPWLRITKLGEPRRTKKKQKLDSEESCPRSITPCSSGFKPSTLRSSVTCVEV